MQLKIDQQTIKIYSKKLMEIYYSKNPQKSKNSNKKSKSKNQANEKIQKIKQPLTSEIKIHLKKPPSTFKT